MDYQTLYRLLEAVEGSLPRVGLVEETEERLKERIELYQVHNKSNESSGVLKLDISGVTCQHGYD